MPGDDDAPAAGMNAAGAAGSGAATMAPSTAQDDGDFSSQNMNLALISSVPIALSIAGAVMGFKYGMGRQLRNSLIQLKQQLLPVV